MALIFLSTFLRVDKLGAGLKRVRRVDAEWSESESVVSCLLLLWPLSSYSMPSLDSVLLFLVPKGSTSGRISSFVQLIFQPLAAPDEL